MKLDNKKTNVLAFLILIFIFFFTFSTIFEDSLTMDELAHLPAGYSYLTQKDMRLNPEHPPLIKDLSAVPLLFINGIKFPYEIREWKDDVNGQWGFGNYFLFKMGNPVEKMIFLARIPMILILIILGFYLFILAKEFFGNQVAIFSLLFFSFSPTFLAHGRLVTTDVGASFGVVLSFYYFIKFLKNSDKKNILLAGFTLGIAQLLKFSLILLIPFYIFLILIYCYLFSQSLREKLKDFLLIFSVAFCLIWVVYFYHTFHYPPEKQLNDTKFILTSYSGGPSTLSEACFSPTSFQKILRCPAEITIWMSNKPILRALAHYQLGLLMIFQRAAGGHTTYFLGEVSAAGWKNYFPIVYVIKEPLSFHFFTILVFIYFFVKAKNWFFNKSLEEVKNFFKNYFTETAMIIFIILYWLTSIRANLNIGVRHLLPVFPFTILLISIGLNKWLKEPFLKLKIFIVGILIFWQVFSVLSVYPHFLSYFNELVGGPEKGYIFVVDSNLDWGQDLKRLAKWVEKRKIDRIYLDYFGGADPQYYLKEKFLPWSGQRKEEEFEKGNYLAVSATFLQGGRGKAGRGFDLPTGYYQWLDKYPLFAKIGYSIFVYYIE